MPPKRANEPAAAGETRWYAMRDLSRPNAKNAAYEALGALPETEGRVFTPMVQRVYRQGGRRTVRLVPYVRDLLFVRQSREVLDPIVQRMELLQYRFVRGGRQGEAMTVHEDEMDRFIRATKAAARVEYYAADDVPPSIYGRRVRIVGGELDGLEGRLMSRRGSRRKRIIVELEECRLAAAVETDAEYIEIVRQ